MQLTTITSRRAIGVGLAGLACLTLATACSSSSSGGGASAASAAASTVASAAGSAASGAAAGASTSAVPTGKTVGVSLILKTLSNPYFVRMQKDAQKRGQQGQRQAHRRGRQAGRRHPDARSAPSTTRSRAATRAS